MPTFTARKCSCTLRDGVEHWVKNRTDWTRHIRQLQLDATGVNGNQISSTLPLQDIQPTQFSIPPFRALPTLPPQDIQPISQSSVPPLREREVPALPLQDTTIQPTHFSVPPFRALPTLPPQDIQPTPQSSVPLLREREVPAVPLQDIQPTQFSIPPLRPLPTLPPQDIQPTQQSSVPPLREREVPALPVHDVQPTQFPLPPLRELPTLSAHPSDPSPPAQLSISHPKQLPSAFHSESAVQPETIFEPSLLSQPPSPLPCDLQPSTAQEKEKYRDTAVPSSILIGVEDMYNQEEEEYDSESDGTDAVGHMNQGMIRPLHVISGDAGENQGDQVVEIEEEDLMDLANISNVSMDVVPATEASSAEYDRRPFALSRSELVSLILHDMAVKYKASRSYVQDQRRLHAALGTKVLDPRAVRRRVCNMTGLREVRYDCCPKSCMSYAMYPGLDRCLEPDCQHPRWKDIKQKVPYAQHSYIPVTQRLLHWWGNAVHAKLMLDYRNGFNEKHNASGEQLDFWTGALCKQFQDRGLFTHETDLAFVLSSDGVKVGSASFSTSVLTVCNCSCQVFKSRRAFYIWPLILVCMNLPPHERFKRQNVLVVGFVPGPNNPKNLDSFMYPLIEEFLALERGIKAWNGYREKSFILHAHIAVVTGDMPGRSKLQGFKGSRALRYCPYCYAKAVHSGRTTYCPLHMPCDAPSNSDAAERADYNVLDLPLRGDMDTRQAAEQIVTLGSDELGKKYGINHLAILGHLSSIDLVRSFPPDSMHLFWENVLPDLVKHWRGKFDTLSTLDPGSTGMKRPAPDTSSIAGQPACKRRAGADTSGVVTHGARRSDKFQTTDDPWNICPSEWDAIGRDMADSHRTFPLHFGEAVRDFWEHCHHLKAAEWENTCLVLLPIYLKDL
jgi:hypothetical protein